MKRTIYDKFWHWAGNRKWLVSCAHQLGIPEPLHLAATSGGPRYLGHISQSRKGACTCRNKGHQKLNRILGTLS